MAARWSRYIPAVVGYVWVRASASDSSEQEQSDPVRKVVTLIENIKAQVESEADQDQAAHDKYMCWCETNDKEKTVAIDGAEQRIEDLSAFIEEAAGTTSQLQESIKVIEGDIADDTGALKEASSLREKESDEFTSEASDLKETRALLEDAVQTLSKVQLLQQQGAAGPAASAAQSAATAALLQVKHRVTARHARFQSIMQRDLFDVMGSFDALAPAKAESDRGFLAAFTQASDAAKQPGEAVAPLARGGAAAGAQSYNARSSGILGILSEMHDEVGRDLAESQKANLRAETDFQNLKASKTSEIKIATEQQDLKEGSLATTLQKSAEAEKDRDATTGSLEADKKFLANLRQGCKAEEDDYKVRARVRGDELVALAETLKILTEDDARELFGKTMTFLQVGASKQATSVARAALRNRASLRALKRLAKAAQKQHNWMLASLAVRVRLDDFSEVKTAMDKMKAQMTKQQKEEYAKWEFCKKEIDKAEDGIKEGKLDLDDLAEKHKGLVNAMDKLSGEVEALRAEEEDMKVGLKQAGEQRKKENQLFQTAVSDQRAAVNILNKALARLKMFYSSNSSFVQIAEHVQEEAPGEPSVVAPPKPGGYEKSAGAGGVLQVLAEVIKDAEIEEQDVVKSEQRAQASYSEFVADNAASIEATRTAIEEKSAQRSAAKADLSETKTSEHSLGTEVAKLEELLHARHVDCDFLLKYIDVRQQSRLDEMDSIDDAKAVLSGADYGK